jgi:hypothetical protein
MEGFAREHATRSEKDLSATRPNEGIVLIRKLERLSHVASQHMNERSFCQPAENALTSLSK